MTNEAVPFQLALGTVLLDIMPIMSPTRAKGIFVLAASLITHKVDDVSRIWKEVYLSTLSKLNDEELRKDVVPIVLLDNGLSQPIQQRIWCGKILGVLSNRIDIKRYTSFNTRVETLIFPKASQLCQDTNHEVRRAMCAEISTISRSVGIKVARTSIFLEFIDLLDDEEVSVQKAALESVMDICDILDTDLITAMLIPTWRKVCVSDNSKLHLASARLFGIFLDRASSINHN